MKTCECGKPVETKPSGFEYQKCYDCWWAQDPRNVKNGGTVDMSKDDPFQAGDKELKAMQDFRKDHEGPQPGPPPAPFSLNNRLVLEPYTKGSLTSSERSGFAMVSQKVAVKGLKVLMDADISNGRETYRSVRKGDIAYIKEELLHTQAWASKVLECEAIEGKFMIVDLMHVDFVVPK